MNYILRTQQQRAIDNLYHHWIDKPESIPLVEAPTGAGKSVIIAELCRLLFDTWPEEKPRTLVLVPSKELAEQNGEKLRALLPSHISLGYYSASLGKREAHCDVIVATIGSVYKSAELLGEIKCVIIDEAHLVNPKAGAGMFRQLLADLSTRCKFRVVGLTATPFRGNGIWLTDGDEALFTGIADKTSIDELLEAGYLSPLVTHSQTIENVIDTSGLSTLGGDYNIGELSEVTREYLSAIADEVIDKAIDRKKWLAFTPTVADAIQLVDEFNQRGITAALVCGETDKKERARHIEDFRNGKIDCLVTVLALAVGFDVPDIDCIIWARSTISPVLYVQGAGRGLRIAEGKTDCLWLDFTTTTERLGPINSIKGRAKKNLPPQDAPFIVCDNCGARIVPASTIVCPDCGHIMRVVEEREARRASEARILAADTPEVYDVTRAAYSIHRKTGKPDSMRVDYFSGLTRVASEWVCPYHEGFAGAKGQNWISAHLDCLPANINQLVQISRLEAIPPSKIIVDESSKYPAIIKKVA